MKIDIWDNDEKVPVMVIKRNPKTLKQILEENKIKNGQKWGDWTFKMSRLTLEYRERKSPNYRYEVDLERCRTSAELLDWIMQIASKAWAKNDILGNLLRALKDCLHPQANLCSFGASKYISLRAKLCEMPKPPLESNLSKLRQENAEREKQIEAMKQYISEQKKKLGMEEGPGLMERLIERRLADKDKVGPLILSGEFATELKRIMDAIKGKKEGKVDNESLMDKLFKDIQSFLGES